MFKEFLGGYEELIEVLEELLRVYKEFAERSLMRFLGGSDDIIEYEEFLEVCLRNLSLKKAFFFRKNYYIFISSTSNILKNRMFYRLKYKID